VNPYLKKKSVEFKVLIIDNSLVLQVMQKKGNQIDSSLSPTGLQLELLFTQICARHDGKEKKQSMA
jgi:hypothetical protein